MPRISSAALATPQPLSHGHSKRLSPPADLDPAATVVWRRIVAACAAGHFSLADSELLRAYCEAAVLSQEAFATMQHEGRVIDGKVSPWMPLLEKSTRALSALAPRLRLGPSARTDPKTTARQLNNRGPASIYDRLGWNDHEEDRHGD